MCVCLCAREHVRRERDRETEIQRRDTYGRVFTMVMLSNFYLYFSLFLDCFTINIDFYTQPLQLPEYTHPHLYTNTPTHNMHIQTPPNTHVKHANTHTPSGCRNSESRCDPASGTLRTCLQGERIVVGPSLALSQQKGAGTLPALEQGSDIPIHPSLQVNTHLGVWRQTPYEVQPGCPRLFSGWR